MNIVLGDKLLQLIIYIYIYILQHDFWMSTCFEIDKEKLNQINDRGMISWSTIESRRYNLFLVSNFLVENIPTDSKEKSSRVSQFIHSLNEKFFFPILGVFLYRI